MNAELILEGLEFRCCHGCLPWEKRHKNLFTVDFKADLDIGRCAESDRLEDTTDLQDVYKSIANEMAIQANLLESLAARILRSLRESHPEFDSIEITVSKKNPPLSPGKARWSRVHISYKR